MDIQEITDFLVEGGDIYQVLLVHPDKYPQFDISLWSILAHEFSAGIIRGYK